MVLDQYFKSPKLEISSIGLGGFENDCLTISAFVHNKPLRFLFFKIKRNPALCVSAQLQTTNVKLCPNQFSVPWNIDGKRKSSVSVEKIREIDIYHIESGVTSKLDIIKKSTETLSYEIDTTVVGSSNCLKFDDRERSFELVLTDIEGKETRKRFMIINLGTETSDIEVLCDEKFTVQSRLVEILPWLKNSLAEFDEIRKDLESKMDIDNLK